MDHLVITRRWTCPVCSGPLWLVFVPSDFDESGHADGTECDEVFCPKGHPVPDDVAEAACDGADEELTRAFEGGFMRAEVWVAPDPAAEAGR